MASRTLIGYRNPVTGAVVSLTVEQAGDISIPVFTESTVVQWATDNTPDGLELSDVRFSPDFEQLYP